MRPRKSGWQAPANAEPAKSTMMAARTTAEAGKEGKMFVDIDEETGTWYAWTSERRARLNDFHTLRGSGRTPQEAKENLALILKEEK